MRNLIIEEQYLVRKDADEIADKLLVMVAGGGTGDEQPLDIEQKNFTILLRHNADVQNSARSGSVRLAKKIPGAALG